LEQLQGVTAQSTTRQPDTSPAPEEALQVQTAGAETQPEHGQGQEHDQAQADQQDQQFSQEQASPQQQTSMELDLSSPGIIAIRDLDKLEGVEEPEQEEEP
jgi:hypothetical protein